MNYHIQLIPRTLHVRQPAGTSRGVYHTRRVWYLLLTADGTDSFGVGECAPLPDLSCDALPDYEEILTRFCHRFEAEGRIDYEALAPYPSILFGLETALLHFQAGGVRFFHTPFSEGHEGIPINTPQQIELRVDANGAFLPEDAPQKLEALSRFGLHSIEQPVRAGQWEVMARLCASAPFPIALDEELIGINERARKIALLDTIRPQYIILKPSLHGGLHGAAEWIKLAAERGIGSWVTSALESNVGLNAIAQWCATLHPQMPQGLGTGLLFTDNVDYPLHIEGDCLWCQGDNTEPELWGYLKGDGGTDD